MAELLIAALERLIAAGVPYADVTVTRLTAEAGIPRWRFYGHFREKHALLRAWFGKFRAATIERIQEAWLALTSTPPTRSTSSSSGSRRATVCCTRPPQAGTGRPPR